MDWYEFLVISGGVIGILAIVILPFLTIAEVMNSFIATLIIEAILFIALFFTEGEDCDECFKILLVEGGFVLVFNIIALIVK